MIINSSRQGGKSLAIEKALTAYIKLNPDAIIIRYKKGESIIEKPVKQVVRKQIEAKR